MNGPLSPTPPNCPDCGTECIWSTEHAPIIHPTWMCPNPDCDWFEDVYDPWLSWGMEDPYTTEEYKARE